MRYAIISDIHGNLTALETVLAYLSDKNIDQFICLGDVAALGPQPQECLHRLRDINCQVVMGNTDDFLLNPTIPEKWKDSPLSHIEKWCAEQLTSDDLEYVRTFQKSIIIDDLILAYHGSPLSYDNPILPTTPTEELDRYFAGYQTRIMLGGHTHHQMIRCYKEASVANPGSVGLAFEDPFDGGASYNAPHAEFAILTPTPYEHNISFHRIAFDAEANFAAVKMSDMPHQDWYIAQWKRSD